jgi:hypothetical protein
MTRRRLVAAPLGILIVAALLAAACGPPRRPSLPTGAGIPFPGFASAYEQAVQECRDVKAITAELALSGRAAGTKLRGRINAGFAAPDDIVLEGVAPFGKPVFVLVGRGGQATLWLPRDDRVLRGEPAEAIVEALAGVALTPVQLRAAVDGCGLGVVSPTAARAYGDEWAALDAPSGTVYLRRLQGRWRVAAAVHDGITVQYGEFAGATPRVVYIRTSTSDLALELSQVDVNVPIDPRAFAIEIPPSAAPLTLQELRRAGPLGEKK